MERHAVPQNIMEVEFKLFGALTVRQFAYLAGGLIIGLLIYFTGLPAALRYALIVISVILGLFLSLVKINGQFSSIWLTNFIVAMFTSQERVWKKSGVVPDVFQEELRRTREQTLEKVKKQGRIKASVTPLTKFETVKVDDTADREEELRLKQIEQTLFGEMGLTQTQMTATLPMMAESDLSGIEVKGYIFDKTDKPVAGALVSINSDNGAFMGEASSDQSGYFVLGSKLAPGTYFASIAAAGMNFEYYKLGLKKGQALLYKFKAK